MPVRIVITDDDALIRDSLKMILELDEEITVVAPVIMEMKLFGSA